MEIKISEIKELGVKVLIKHGYTTKESEEIFESLLWSQRRESSQGISKLFGWRIEKLPNATSATIEKNEPNLLLVNANLNNHILACNLAVEEILKNIGQKPIFVAGVKNAVNSAGSIGYFTEKLAKAGLVSIMMSAADPGISTHGGSEAVFGTNPISIAVPTDSNPVLFDMSVASLTWGDLIKYDDVNKPLPEGFAFDESGEATTSAKAAMDGCVTSFDKSYKGSGLAMMIQILAGPLVGSLYSKNHTNCQYGSLIIVINPSCFGDKKEFVNRVVSMVNEVKNSRKAKGFEEILIPGEGGYRNTNKHIGSVEIPEELYKKMTDFILGL